VSRIRELEERRRMLIERSEQQRVDLAARLGQLDALSLLRGAPAGHHGGPRLRRPFAWAAAVAGLLLLGRTRELVTFVLWIRSALSLAARAAHILRLIGQLRSPRAGGTP
jgi:hypothetical protein